MNRFLYLLLVVTLLAHTLSYAEQSLSNGAVLRDPTQPANVERSQVTLMDKELQLSAIIISANKKIAIINGDYVSVGDQVGRGVVTKISPQAVTVQVAENRKILELTRSIRRKNKQ